MREWSTTHYNVIEPGVGTSVEDVHSSGTLIALSADANLVISPMQHFALLFGPFVDLTVSGREEVESDLDAFPNDEVDREVVVYGLQLGIAGYF